MSRRLTDAEIEGRVVCVAQMAATLKAGDVASNMVRCRRRDDGALTTTPYTDADYATDAVAMFDAVEMRLSFGPEDESTPSGESR